MKRVLAAAAILLFVGGGCPAPSAPSAPPPAAPSAEKEGAMMLKADEVDAAADAYLEASLDEQAAAEREDADVTLLGSTDSQLNGYGQTYDESEF